MLSLLGTARSATVLYDAELDWTGSNPWSPWSAHTSTNPIGPPSSRAGDFVTGPTIGAAPGTSFGNADEGKVICCGLRVVTSFTMPVYIRFENPTAAFLTYFFELTAVNPHPPDAAAYIYADEGQIYQGGGPVSLDLGFRPARAIVEFGMVSLGCCGDVYDVDLRVAATTLVSEPPMHHLLLGMIATMALSLSRRRVGLVRSLVGS